MADFFQQFASEFIAGLAVIVSVIASWRASRTERLNRESSRLNRRMEVLIEIEKNNSIIGKLCLIISQKILLLRKFEDRFTDTSTEIYRLQNNLELMKEFKDNENSLRESAELDGGGKNLEEQSHALTYLRRLGVRLAGDLEKETIGYQDALDQLREPIA